MKRDIIKLHRGVDNDIPVSVKNLDYKLVGVEQFDVKAKLIDPINGEKIFERYLTHGKCKGQLNLRILEGDLVDVPAGFYQMVIVAEDKQVPGNVDTYVASPFFTDQDDNITYEVEVTGQGDSTPYPTVELDPSEWPLNYDSMDNLTMYSPAIPCNSFRNNLSSVHTFALYSNGFYGTVELLGSLDINPQTEISQYFPISIVSGSPNISFTDYTGVEAYTVNANLVWVKFKIVFSGTVPYDDNGRIEKILWRS